ncbi:MAG TPA: hypothetical protein VGH38_24580 [Bryobacteraceae bacterium]
MALGLSAGLAHSATAVSRFVSSAETFRYYFRDLKNAGSSLSPIERFVMSVVLANTKAPQVHIPCTAADRQT